MNQFEPRRPVRYAPIRDTDVYESDSSLIIRGGIIFALMLALFTWNVINAWTAGPGGPEFSSDVGWAVFCGLIALFSGTRIVTRWRASRAARKRDG